jgi:hypothetical protein
VIGPPTVLDGFSSGSIFLISSHNLSGILMMGGRWWSLSYLTSSVFLLDTGHIFEKVIMSYNPIEFWDRLLV